MKDLFIDLETSSSVDLAGAGVYRYAEARDFKILLLAYSVDGGPVEIADIAHYELIPLEVLRALTDRKVTKWAYNCNFERVCLSKFLGYPVNTFIEPEQFKCVMTWGAYLGLPMSLEKISEVMHLQQGKLDTGKALIRKFCKSSSFLPMQDDSEWQMFCEYCKRDVEAEIEICEKLSPWPVPEFVWQEFWDSERINDRGIAVDRQLVRNAIRLNEAVTQELTEELEKLTGLQNPNSVSQLRWWLQEQGVTVNSLGKKEVEKLLKGELSDVVRQALLIRQQLSKSSVKKYQAMQASVNADGRVRGLFQFYGANRTGRFASKRIQLQNLPKNHMEDLDDARRLLKAGEFKTLTAKYPDVQDVLSQLVRTAFVPTSRGECEPVARKETSAYAPGAPSELKEEIREFSCPPCLKGVANSGATGVNGMPVAFQSRGVTEPQREGCEADRGIQSAPSEQSLTPVSCILTPDPCILTPGFLVADESAIEARILSYLSGERWRIRVFAEGQDIYCASASQMFHVPVEKNGQNANLRTKGKIAELALGYGGSVGALEKMGALEMGLEESELQPIVDAWRAANPRIVKFWYDIGDAAMNAVIYRATTQSHGFRFIWEKGFLFIELLSGRRLAYYGARLGTNRFGSDCITYYGVGASKKWERLETYGPKLVENIVQATARDVLCYAIGNLEECSIVMHVHDEIICEAGRKLSLEELCEIMGRTPPWMEGLLLKAEGFETQYYRKD